MSAAPTLRHLAELLDTDAPYPPCHICDEPIADGPYRILLDAPAVLFHERCAPFARVRNRAGWPRRGYDRRRT